MIGNSNKKTWRHGSVSIALTVAVVAIAVLINTIFSTLAERYKWYGNMNPTLLYPVTDECFDFLDEHVYNDEKASINIIFCDTEPAIAESATQKFVLYTANELIEKYPEKLNIKYMDIYQNPSMAKKYGATASTDVIFEYGDRHVRCTAKDFFVFATADQTTPLAYMGNRRFAVAMKAVTEKNTPVCYFTMNHGESFADNEILHTAVDAGYNVSYIDLLKYDIPEDCEMLITYNPKQDLTSKDGVSGISEYEKLEAFLKNGGKYAFFASADTFATGGFENFEALLEKWGISYRHSTNAQGVEESPAVRDKANSVTTDGYTLLANIESSALGEIDGSVRLSNAAIIDIRDDISSDKTVQPLLKTYAGAEAWAAGRAVDKTSDGFTLMTLTKSTEGGSLLAVSSTEFAEEAAMQSTVYKNKDVMLTAISQMGKDDVPVGIASQPFTDDEIRTLTVRDAQIATVLLTALPPVILAALALFILLRRKFAN